MAMGSDKPNAVTTTILDDCLIVAIPMRRLGDICADPNGPTVEEALALAERTHPDLVDGATLPGDHASAVAETLAAEVRRLRAQVSDFEDREADRDHPDEYGD